MPRKKVKDMPRKQQMAVKASMAEQASPAKLGPVAAMVAGKVAGKVADKVVDSAFKMTRSEYKTPENVADESKKSKKVSKEKSMKQSGSPFKLKPKSPLMGKISAACKARAKKKFDVWPSAFASGWGVRCTQGKV